MKDIHMRPGIFLIGFMGSGKSYWGEIWSQKLKYHFYDLDCLIEKSFSMDVATIFEKEGEEKFREIERLCLQKFDSKKNFILSCGGGTPCFLDNMDWMLSHGKVIYLKADAEYILERVVKEKEKRPLLKDVNDAELLFFIQKKIEEREPYYSRANTILEAQRLNEESLDELMN